MLYRPPTAFFAANCELCLHPKHFAIAFYFLQTCVLISAALSLVNYCTV